MTDMIQTAHALLLIASLLACPFQCAGVVTAGVVQTPSCSCCEFPSLPVAETEPGDHEQVPLTPSGDCDCSNCLCKGAVLTDNDPVHDAVVAGSWFIDVLPPTNSPAAGNVAAGPKTGPPLLMPAAGRSLRLILQSLQI